MGSRLPRHWGCCFLIGMVDTCAHKRVPFKPHIFTNILSVYISQFKNCFGTIRDLQEFAEIIQRSPDFYNFEKCLSLNPLLKKKKTNEEMRFV